MGLARAVLDGPNDASRTVGTCPFVCNVLTVGTRPVRCRTTLLPPERGEKASRRSPLIYGSSVPFATKAAAPHLAVGGQRPTSPVLLCIPCKSRSNDRPPGDVSRGGVDVGEDRWCLSPACDGGEPGEGTLVVVASSSYAR
jgi:hypothetical protein